MYTEARSKSSQNIIKCDMCGMIFSTQAEKDGHMRLEHTEHQKPAGVG